MNELLERKTALEIWLGKNDRFYCDGKVIIGAFLLIGFLISWSVAFPGAILAGVVHKFTIQKKEIARVKLELNTINFKLMKGE